jgi:predicted PurR-regulated permease PerM
MGVVLWSLSEPIFERMVRFTRGHRTLAAGLTVLGTVLLIVLPLALLLTVVVFDAGNLVQAMNKWLEPHRPEIEQRVRELARGDMFRMLGMDLNIQDVMSRLEQFGTRAAGILIALSERAVNGVLEIVVTVFIMLYTQFFFCRGGQSFLRWLAGMIPLAPEQSNALFEDFFATARATLKTFVVIGAIQGGLGGLAFWVIGIPAPLFWTIVMAFASAIPSVGAQLILVPVSIVLIAIGNTWAGIGLLAWSIGVISMVDNLARPYVVGRDVNLHEVLVLVSTLGGIETFGILGLVIGPVIAALLQASLRIYREIYAQQAEPAST